MDVRRKKLYYNGSRKRDKRRGKDMPSTSPCGASAPRYAVTKMFHIQKEVFRSGYSADI